MGEIQDVYFKGIQRNTPDASNNGACEEVINMRFNNGAWRPVGNKVREANNHGYTNVAHHSQDDIANYIGYKPNVTGPAPDYVVKNIVYWFVLATGAVTQTILTLTPPEYVVKFEFLKRFLIIITDKSKYIFLNSADTNTYIRVDVFPSLVSNSTLTPIELKALDYTRPQATTSGDTAEKTETIGSVWDDISGVLGKYYKKLDELSEESIHFGTAAWRVAFKLYDGTYIHHTVPQIVAFGDTVAMMGFQTIHTNGTPPTMPTSFTPDLKPMDVLIKGEYRTDTEIRDVELWFKPYKAELVINTEYFQTFSHLSDIIESIVVFCSPIIERNNASEILVEENRGDSIYIDNNISTWNNVLFSSHKEIIKDYEDILANIPAYYKVGEVPFSEILAKSPSSETDYSELLDFKDFYDNYATRETMTLDSGSNHTIIPHEILVYNDRLIGGNVTTEFALPMFKKAAYHNDYRIEGGTWIGANIGVISLTTTVILNELGQEKVIKYNQNFLTYNFIVSVPPTYIIFPAIIGYPDSRATRIIISAVGDDTHIYFNKLLTKSTNFNYATFSTKAQFIDYPDYSGSEVYESGFNYHCIERSTTIYDTPIVTIPTATDRLLLDSNRVQVSLIQNPLAFDAANSYQVGTGEIVGVGTIFQAISEGQFGQFPINIFTSKGIYTLEQGTISGTTLFSNVVPLSDEVLMRSGALISTGIGTIFISKDGLKVIAGRNIVNLTKAAEGEVSVIYSNTDYAYFSALAKTGNLNAYLSQVDYLTYLQNAIIGYDKYNEELLISNTTYTYSYVYSFENKTIHKITSSYDQFVNVYPQLEGYSSIGYYSISNEDFTGKVAIGITTSSMDFNLPNIKKVLEFCILRGTFHTSSASDERIGAYLFGATSQLTWVWANGYDRTKGDFSGVRIGRTGGSFPYFSFVMFGLVDDLKGTYVSKLSAEIKRTMTNKLR